jgi:hypothetical protein
MSELTPWQKYKEKMGDTRPWDLLNPEKNRASEEVANARYEVCSTCPEFINVTKQCKQCGCFMAAKTKLARAVCPLEKW